VVVGLITARANFQSLTKAMILCSAFNKLMSWKHRSGSLRGNVKAFFEKIPIGVAIWQSLAAPGGSCGVPASQPLGLGQSAMFFAAV
jgi:hypothetical protein